MYLDVRDLQQPSDYLGQPDKKFIDLNLEADKFGFRRFEAHLGENIASIHFRMKRYLRKLFLH